MKSIALIALLCCGCDNVLSRRYGGSQTVKLTNCNKLVNVTWKESNMWILTRPCGEAGHYKKTCPFLDDGQ